MKLQNKNNNRLKVILIVVIAVVVLAAIGFGIFTVVNTIIQEQEGKKVSTLNISTYPQQQFNVGDKFSAEGIKVQVITKDFSNGYFVDIKDLRFEGFDSSVACESQTIKVYYGEIYTSYTIKIVDPTVVETPYLTAIEVINFQTTYSLADWNDKNFDYSDVKIKCIYSDGSETEIPMSSDYVKGWKKLDASGEVTLTVKYTENRYLAQQKITVTITN